MLSRVFDLFDTNSDGSMAYNEFCDAVYPCTFGGTAAEAARVKQPYTKAAARGCALQGTARCEQPPRCCGLPSQPPLIFFRLSYLSLSPLSALPSFPPPLPVKRQATRMALLSLRAAA